MSTVDYDLLAVPETTQRAIAALNSSAVQQNEQWVKRQVAVFNQETAQHGGYTRRPNESPVKYVTLDGRTKSLKQERYENALLFGMCLATGFIVWKLVYGNSVVGAG